VAESEGENQRRLSRRGRSEGAESHGKNERRGVKSEGVEAKGAESGGLGRMREG
jgi:hypothetical protein